MDMTKPWLVKVGVLFIKKRGCIVLTHPHTWLPYLTPNGVTHLTMLLIDIKILQNRAGKNHGF